MMLRVAMLVLVAVGCAASAGAANAADAARTCAVMTQDTELGAVATLLEQELARLPGVTLVERDLLERVQQEQQLAVAFEPAGGGRRVELGRLVKADVLVLLRRTPAATGEAKDANDAKDGKDGKDVGAGKEAGPAATQIVVCETAGGIRLMTQLLPPAAPERDAAAIAKSVREALARHQAGGRLVVAVPPFVNRDLSYEFDYLQGAFAEIAQERLLRRRGDVWLVELAEAEAIGRELAIAGRGERVRRPMPIYLLGEYRHEQARKGRAVGVTLVARQGERELARRKLDAVPAPAAAREVAAAAEQLLAEAAGKPAPAPSATTAPTTSPVPDEAAQLAARAKLFLSLGHWPEAVDLIEASLLLNPDQPDLHRDAVRALTNFLPNRISYRSIAVPADRRRQPATHYYQRGLLHLEQYARATELNGREDGGLFGHFLGTLDEMQILRSGGPPPVPKEQFEQIRALTQKVLGELLADKARRRVVDDTPGLVGGTYVETFGTYAQSEAARFKLIDDFLYLPKDKRHHLVNAASPLNPINWGSDECISFFSRAAGHPDEAIRKEAERWLALQLRARAGDPISRPPEPPKKAVAVSDPQVTFTKLELGQIGKVLDWERAGDDLDVIAADKPPAVYVMREEGKLEPLDLAVDGAPPIKGVRELNYDGRLMWAVVGEKRNVSMTSRRLVAFDPRTGRCWEFGAADGLPAQTHEYAIAPIGPGRACVMGWFGRTWCAELSVGGDGKKSVRMVREFHEIPERDIGEKHVTVNTAFNPVGIAVVRPADAAGAGTSSGALAVVDRHIRIKLADGSAELVGDSNWVDERVWTHDGTYLYAWWGTTGSVRVERFGFADVRTANVLVDGKYPMDNNVFRHIDGRFHAVGICRGPREQWLGRFWAVADKFDGPYTTLRVNWPEDFGDRRGLDFDVFASAHYSLVMVFDGKAYHADRRR